MRILFMGTPAFAVPCLLALIDGEDEVAAVFTQPDKPVGRKGILTAPPVKELALQHGVFVCQPAKLKDSTVWDTIRSLKPDLIVVTAYGKILPKEILSIPQYGAICIHASLLPKLRGAAPIQWSIINGDATTGITAMQINEGVDTGDILLSKTLKIHDDETAGELAKRMSYLGAEVLKETLMQLKSNRLSRIKQDDNASSYAPMLSKELSPIDWTESARSIHNRVRGLNPWPSATMILNGGTVKVHKTAVGDMVSGNPGDVIAEKASIIVVCGDGCGLKLLELQPENKKSMTAAEYLRGHAL